jgi:peptidoglycan hydrolase-like protein with peptidoglycan-binding domain
LGNSDNDEPIQIDAIFGDLTRQAIRGYQSSLGDDQTGYLTPQQLQSLEE